MLHKDYSRGPGRAWFTLAWIACGFTLLAFAGTPALRLPMVLAVICWTPCFLILLVRVGARCLVPPARHRLRVSSAMFWSSTARGLGVGVLCLVLIWLDAPFAGRLAAGYPWLSALADDAERSPASVIDVEGWHGTFRLIAIFKQEGSVVFEWGHRKATWIERGRWDGILRLRQTPAPPGTERSPLPITRRWLVGDWYLWRWDDGSR